MQVGDKIAFGRYEWRVLDIQNNAALIITCEQAKSIEIPKTLSFKKKTIVNLRLKR